MLGGMIPLFPQRLVLPSVFLCLALGAAARPGVRKVTDGFERPVWAGMPAGSAGKLWVMEQAGRVWVVDLASGRRAERPFLDIREEVSRKGNEEGLLGLAFAADYGKTGRYYVNFTDRDRHTRIMRYVAKGGATDAAAGEVVLKFRQPHSNHNGGWLDFGPDGMLYIGNGDGGSGNDPDNYGQRLDTLLGKILRIDVSAGTGYRIPADNPFTGREDAKGEIWAYGVRNPWRCSFDRETGDFWMADVGQNAWEEINHMPKGRAAGANYGWRLREGWVATPTGRGGGGRPPGAVDPVYVYAHGTQPNEGFSVTGGYVYRGPVKELRGRYLFADYINPRIWSIRLKDGKAVDFTDHTADLQPDGGQVRLVSSFAESPQGDVFIIDHGGPVYQIVER